MKNKHCCLILLFTFILFPSFAVSLDRNPFLSNSQYEVFKNIVLPFDANQVNVICQDSQGMIWLGTKRGLFSYNGYNVQEYIHPDGPDQNYIFATLQIGDKLYLGTDFGLLLFNLQTEQYEFPGEPLSSLKAVRSLIEFEDKLWIGTRNDGLYCYDYKDRSFYKKALENVDETVVNSMEIVGNKLFVGTYEGLSYYDIFSGTRVRIPFPDGRQLMVSSLLWDAYRNVLWIGTEGYLYKYHLETSQLLKEFQDVGNTFEALAIDGRGNLLMGTDRGLYVYDFGEQRITHVTHDSRNAQSLSNNVVWSAFCDTENCIWLGTDYGVSFAQFAPLYKTVHISEITQSKEGNLFTHVYKDSYDDYWLGGENGLIHLEQQGDSYKVRWFHVGDQQYSLPHNRIRSVYEDRDRNIWITTDGGVSGFDRGSGRFNHYSIVDKSGKRTANWVYGLYEDTYGRLWISTYISGLFIADKKELLRNGGKEPYVALNNLSDEIGGLSELGDIVYQMIPAKGGLVWINTQKGLASVDESSLKVELKEVYLDNVHGDSEGDVWYSSLGKLYKMDKKTSEVTAFPFSAEIGSVYSIFEVGNETWLTASNGVYRVEKETRNIRNVSRLDSYCQSGFYDPQNNVLLLGGKNCLVCIYPDQLRKRASHPVHITSAYINGKRLLPSVDYETNSLRFQKRLLLNEVNSNVSLDLSSFSYLQQDGEYFYYKINKEGEWSSLEKEQNQIKFANLSSGEYTLFLANSDPLEDENSLINTFLISVPYPWYRAPAAYLVYALLSVAFILLLIRKVQRQNRVKYERKEREKTLELSNLKMDFFVNIAHELKTPLSLIIAPLSQLISETRSERQKEKLEVIHQNSLRLNTLIHKVLDFRQVEYDKENTVIRSHVELCTLLENSIRTFSSLLEEKQVKVLFDANKDQCWLNLDVIKMESVLVNLLSNAVNHLPAKDGEITIMFRAVSEKVVITIQDNGSGIKEDELSLVFLRFFQGKATRKSKRGSGIGLYLVRKFVELHDGSIEIRNRHLNKGVVVEISLPTEGENAISTGLSVEEPIEIDPTAEEHLFKLLIVDDNKEILDFLVGALSGNYLCRKAYDGEEGFIRAQEERPDLIIVDQMMPKMDGLEFCRSIRNFQPTSSIPIIMLTAKDDLDTELKSIKIGVDVFLSKPFDIKILQLRIAQLLQSRKSLEKSIRIENLTQSVSTTANNSMIDKTSDEVLIENVIKRVEEHLEDEEFNITALAESLSIDQKQLYRKIKKLTGLTPVNYVRQIKMKKAAMLLSQNKFTVSEVMYLVGYTNASYFSKCFQSELGVSPKQFITNTNETSK